MKSLLKSIFFSTLLAFAQSSFSQDLEVSKEYSIIYGSSPNIESSAESIVGVSSFVFDQVNTTIEEVDERGLRFLLRFTNLTFLQLYAGGLAYGTLMHEQFGHKSRANEFGLPLELKYNFPGLGGDFYFPVSQDIPSLQRQLVVGAGFEASSFIAFHATKSMYKNEYSGTYIGWYFMAGKVIEGALTSQMDIVPFLEDPNRYYATNTRLSRNPIPNDPLAYLLALTESYGYFDDFLDSQEPWVQRVDDMTLYTDNTFINDQNERIKKTQLLAAIDPSNLYALYGTFIYLFKGTLFMKPFMPKINGISFMPSVRANYGELGAENYFDLYMKLPKKLFISFNYRSGGNMFHLVRGGGIEFENINIKQLQLGVQFDYWKNQRQGSNNINFLLKNRYTPNEKVSMYASFGYKSEGFLMGKPFQGGFYGYFGIGINMRYMARQ